MALRAWWTGSIYLDGSVSFPVQAVKGTQASEKEARMSVVRLCSCHHRPFHRPADECVGGSHPKTAAAEARGDEDLTDVVYGIEVESDDEDEAVTYKVVDLTVDPEVYDDEIAQLEDLWVERNDIVPFAQVPAHAFNDLWYLRPNVPKGKKGKSQLALYATLAQTLKAKDWAITSVWGPRDGMRKLAVVHAVTDPVTGELVLAMNLMPFADQVRTPDEKIRAHTGVMVPPAAVDRMAKILGPFVGKYDPAKYENSVVAAKAHRIEEQLGERGDAPSPMQARVDESEDLMAALEAALADVPSGDSDEPVRAQAPAPAPVSARDRLIARRKVLA